MCKDTRKAQGNISLYFPQHLPGYVSVTSKKEERRDTWSESDKSVIQTFKINLCSHIAQNTTIASKPCPNLLKETLNMSAHLLFTPQSADPQRLVLPDVLGFRSVFRLVPLCNF